MRGLRVREPGPLTLVQDLGRPGLAGVGVGRSGAADRSSLRLAHRLLGDDEDRAALEVTGGGLEVEVADAQLWVCVTGAPCEVRVDDGPVGSHAVVPVPPGARVRLGPPATGLRSYLAVRGGIDVAPVLGSRSRDLLAGLGPAPLAAGDELAVGEPTGPLPDVGAVAPPRWDEPEVVLRAVLGPREDRVVDPEVLVAGSWLVGSRSDRVAARLERPAERPGERSGESRLLRHVGEDQLPSEGLWRGAVQVPPRGEPVLFLADHPVTGGYPVVAVVIDADVDRAAQLAPGRRLRLRWA